MRDVFVMTNNFKRFLELAKELEAPAGQGLAMAAVVGRAGRGKTTAAQRLASVNSAVYCRFCDWWTPTGLLREVAFLLGGIRPRATQRCFEVIHEELARERRLIMVDEADRLSLRHLNTLRDLHDVCGVPVMLIGEEPLLSRLAQERRLKSRVRTVLKFEPVAPADVAIFYREALSLTLSGPQAQELAKHAEGDFRLVVKDALSVERIMRASGLKGPEVPAKVLKEVCK